MTDIFISYKSEDNELARLVASALTIRGYVVWWDASLLSGDIFADAINKVLDEAKLTITLWTRAATQSVWVKAESSRALEQGKYLGVILEENLELPVPFNAVQAFDFIPLHEETADLDPLVREIERTLGSPSACVPSDVAENTLKDAEAQAALWWKIHDTDDADAFRYYLKSFGPSAVFAEVAEAKITAIEGVGPKVTKSLKQIIYVGAALAAISVGVPEAYQRIQEINGRWKKDANYEMIIANLHTDMAIVRDRETALRAEIVQAKAEVDEKKNTVPSKPGSGETLCLKQAASPYDTTLPAGIVGVHFASIERLSAERDCRLAIDGPGLKLDLPRLWFSYGRILHRFGKEDDALFWYRKASASGFHLATHNLATIYISKVRFIAQEERPSLPDSNDKSVLRRHYSSIERHNIKALMPLIKAFTLIEAIESSHLKIPSDTHLWSLDVSERIKRGLIDCARGGGACPDFPNDPA